MNWDYVSGFFDADGSVTLVNLSNSKNKTIQLSFHNNELSILNSIKTFIDSEIGCNGVISTKKPRKINHSVSFDLKYSYSSALDVANRISTIHPKKKHRIEIYQKIQEVTPRNGKYTDDLRKRRSELEELFWKH